MIQIQYESILSQFQTVAMLQLTRIIRQKQSSASYWFDPPSSVEYRISDYQPSQAKIEWRIEDGFGSICYFELSAETGELLNVAVLTYWGEVEYGLKPPLSKLPENQLISGIPLFHCFTEGIEKHSSGTNRVVYLQREPFHIGFTDDHSAVIDFHRPVNIAVNIGDKILIGVDNDNCLSQVEMRFEDRTVMNQFRSYRQSQ